MHSDSWAGVAYENCPPDIQANHLVCRRMDAFYLAARANESALASYVESLYLGQSIGKPKPVSVPSVQDEEMEFMMADSIACAANVVAVMLADDAQAISFCLAGWIEGHRRKADYLAYNRKALEKRYRKGSDQEEIDRVKKLIADGEAEIAFLQPRIAWAEAQKAAA